MEWLKRRQPVAQIFELLLAQAERGEVSLCISRINLGEIYYNLAKDFGETAGLALFAQFQHLRVEVASITDGDIDLAAKLKARYSFSYADAFAAVLSRSRGAPLVTGDHEFKQPASDGVLALHWLGK
jgi:predicted nucleic acid-binding protein